MNAPAPVHPFRRVALHALLAAVGLGLLGDLRFRDAALGLNLLLWVAALGAVAAFLSHRHALRPQLPDQWLLVALGFASCLAIRDSRTIGPLDLMAVMLALSLVPLRHVAEARSAPLSAWLRAAGRTAGQGAGGALLLPLEDVPWDEIRGRRATGRMAPVLVGLGLATPLVIVFGLLFASADPVFRAFADSLVGWNLGPLPAHAVVTSCFGWISAALLRAWLREPAAPRRAELVAIPSSLRPESVLIAVGSMALVFTIFVGLQANALFRNDSWVQAAAG